MKQIIEIKGKIDFAKFIIVRKKKISYNTYL